jgi:hypothetical protein
MVKSKEQANRIQAKRAAKGMRGLAMAVKRFLKRQGMTASELK